MLQKTNSAPSPSKQAERTFDINHQRRRDIARLVVERHGKLAKAQLCIPYAVAAAWHCPSDSERRFLMAQWCRWTCAPLSVVKQIDAILTANPARRISADALARHLHVSDAERTALRIWTIGAFDVPRAKRIKRRKENRRLAAQARRRARNATPREQSYSRTKPWEAFGIKRRAWERRGKPTPATTQIRGHDTCFAAYGYEFASSPVAPAGSTNGHPRQPQGRQTDQVGGTFQSLVFDADAAFFAPFSQDRFAQAMPASRH
jgi:hypothetical protein